MIAIDLEKLKKIKVGQVMRREVLTLPGATTVEKLTEIMLVHKHDEVLVTGPEGNLAGIITKNDLAKSLARGVSGDTAIGQIMTPQVFSVGPEDDLLAVRSRMRRLGIGRAPVLSPDGQLLGILTAITICDGFSSRMEDIARHLELVLDSSGDALFVLTRGGRLLYTNSRARELAVKEGSGLFSLEGILGKEMFQGILTGKVIGDDNVCRWRQGDYLVAVKGFSHNGEAGFVVSLRDITQVKKLLGELEQARHQISHLEERLRGGEGSFGQLVFRSSAMKRVVELARKAAATEATICITGESGTGKEVLGRAIHDHSGRREGPLVTVNCSAIPPSLFESEVFGYEPGAFTGALRGGKGGLLEAARGGTVFLDEVGELPLEVQAKLLRVLEDGSFYRVGGTRPIQLDARVIAATNRDLEEMVSRGAFREDLYYRINVISLRVPPLRERPEDLLPLLWHFIQHFNRYYQRKVRRIEPRTLACLEGHPWPGNVRQLKNTVERMVIFVEGDILTPGLLPGGFADNLEDSPPLPKREGGTLEALQREAILRALKESEGNKSRAARALGIPRSSLYYKMKVLGIEA